MIFRGMSCCMFRNCLNRMGRIGGMTRMGCGVRVGVWEWEEV